MPIISIYLFPHFPAYFNFYSITQLFKRKIKATPPGDVTLVKTRELTTTDNTSSSCSRSVPFTISAASAPPVGQVPQSLPSSSSESCTTPQTLELTVPDVVSPIPSPPFLPTPPALTLEMDQSVQLLMSKEAIYQPDPTYIARHPEMKPRMRAVLMDWLIEVWGLFTLYLYYRSISSFSLSYHFNFYLLFI